MKLESGDRVRLTWSAKGAEHTITGAYAGHEVYRDVEDIVGPDSIFPTASWVTDLGSAFWFENNVKIEIPPNTQWTVEILEKAKLPTKPGSILFWYDCGRMENRNAVLGLDGRWYAVEASHWYPKKHLLTQKAHLVESPLEDPS